METQIKEFVDTFGRIKESLYKDLCSSNASDTTRAIDQIGKMLLQVHPKIRCRVGINKLDGKEYKTKKTFVEIVMVSQLNKEAFDVISPLQQSIMDHLKTDAKFIFTQYSPPTNPEIIKSLNLALDLKYTALIDVASNFPALQLIIFTNSHYEELKQNPSIISTYLLLHIGEFYLMTHITKITLSDLPDNHEKEENILTIYNLKNDIELVLSKTSYDGKNVMKCNHCGITANHRFLFKIGSNQAKEYYCSRFCQYQAFKAKK